MPGPEYLSSIINFWRVYSGIDKESEISCKKFLSTIINTKNILYKNYLLVMLLNYRKFWKIVIEHKYSFY